MSWFVWIIVGLIAGWLASRLTGRRRGLLMNLAIGLIGSLLGGWIVGGLGVDYASDRFWPALGVSVLGALVLLAVLNFLFGDDKRH